MSIAQSFRSSPELALATVSQHRCWQQWRLPILCILLLVSLGFTLFLRMTAPPIDTPVASWIILWILSFLPYLAASVLILATRPLEGRWCWVELGIILLGALLLRSILLPLPPNLSHDSWRYLWDARITLHGYSPYVYAPHDAALVHLRNFIYDNSRFRNVPTLYPPAAQAVYLLSYLIAPDNLVVFKGILVLLEIVTCGALIALLRSRGLDPSRCLIYAWCPLPIVEFAMQGHHEAITLVFTLLALVSSQSSWRWNSVLTGLLIALATLTNIYPILLLLVVLPRRNRVWMITCLVACGITVILAYIPYVILGHGRAFGFLTTYVSEHSWNGGSVFLFIQWLNQHLQFNGVIAHILSYTVDLLLVGGIALAIWWQRQRERISMEAGTLILIGTVFCVSTHVFPWYNTALLPYCSILRRIEEKEKTRRNPPTPPDVGHSKGTMLHMSSRFVPGGLSIKGLAAAMAWYFACASVSTYLVSSNSSWPIYYLCVYDPVLIGLGIATFVGFRRMRTKGKA